MVTKFLVDNKRKRSLKKCIRTVANFIDSIQFRLISQTLAKFSGVESQSLEKEKENFCVLFPYSIKRAREFRKFHVAIVQRRLRNVQKVNTDKIFKFICSIRTWKSYLPFGICHCFKAEKQ